MRDLVTSTEATKLFQKHLSEAFAGEYEDSSPQAIFCFSREWGSEAAGYRQEIRRALVTELGLKTPAERTSLLDLTKIPSFSGRSISISHCPSIGGFGLLSHPVQFGLDVEEIGRIHLDIVERVSEAAEIKRAPRYDFLWVAKEAVFKSLYHSEHQGLTISQVKVTSWLPSKYDGAFCFYVDVNGKPLGGRGLSLIFEDWAVAVFLN